MKSGQDKASTLLQKAAGDRIALRVLGDSDDDVMDWSWAFHAQQAIEKAIKAVLAHEGVIYPYTHKLRVLTSLQEHQIPLRRPQTISTS